VTSFQLFSVTETRMNFERSDQPEFQIPAMSFFTPELRPLLSPESASLKFALRWGRVLALWSAAFFFPAICPAQDSPPDSSAAPKVFKVRDEGATGDGHTLDTEAIQKALDKCGHTGGGIVEIPAGTYVTKPLFLRGDNTTLQLDEGAVLQARDTPEDFAIPGRASPTTSPYAPLSAFVNADHLHHIAITGPGRIDGAGAWWWPAVETAKAAGQPEPRRRPRLVVLTACTDVRVEGVTLTNSPSFHLVPTDCENVTIKNITIRAPSTSPNTDAIDPSSCWHVLISNCTLDVGDDNVAIKAGHPNPAHDGPSCEDILVTNCTMLHGHGMSIGSETNAGVSNLTVTNCTFRDTVSGLRIKSDRARGGLVQNVIYRDLTMANVTIPINFTCYYPKVPASDPGQAVTDTTPAYEDILVSNLTATGATRAGIIVGLPESPITRVRLENVRIAAAEGLTIRNTTDAHLDNVHITAGKGKPLLVENATVNGVPTP
jgi:polygalacturonase